jgi:hypothetical protein
VARKAQAKQVIKLLRRERQPDNAPNSSKFPSKGSPESYDPYAVFFGTQSSLSSLQSPTVSCALVPSRESQGIRYFLVNYVMDDVDFCAGHMQNLRSWKTTQSKTLQVAMGAVGLAGLSNQRNDLSLMAKARHQYALALRMTKGHLADPSRCKQDRTITAVGLLGLFEVCFLESFKPPIC